MPDPNRVLLVEDNEQSAELACYLLEEAGLLVELARDAVEARAAWARLRPSVVLMDMDLPGTDGLTLLGELRRDPRLSDLPVVALTAHAMRGDRERFLESGCAGYIAKPIQVATFAAEVERYLREGLSHGR
jgi:two-component system cell cycle response regulator DivK